LIRDKVKGYIAPLYALDITTGGLLDSGADEIEALETDIASVLQQFFVDTATWGLAQWESFLGIAGVEGKPDNERRSVIKSKLRGSGTVTVSLLQNIAEAYDHGTIEVTEQPVLYQVKVRFVDTLGRPPNLPDIQRAIEAAVPAHIAVTYSFRYLTIADVNAMTLNQIETHPLSDFAPFLG
jgi:uncharacterized protein YmfQ (DUF2313 family)